jgi:hypothetical protein
MPGSKSCSLSRAQALRFGNQFGHFRRDRLPRPAAMASFKALSSDGFQAW